MEEMQDGKIVRFNRSARLALSFSLGRQRERRSRLRMTAANRIRLNSCLTGNAYTGFAASAGTAYKDPGHAIRTGACSGTGRRSSSTDRVCMGRNRGGANEAVCIYRTCTCRDGDASACICHICIRHDDDASVCICRICIRHGDDASACIYHICIHHGDDASACIYRICIHHGDDACSYDDESCRHSPAYTSTFSRRCTFSILLSRPVPIQYCSAIALTNPD